MTHKVEEVLPRIYHVAFDNDEDLWRTFIRYQEFYESPKFHGRKFTLLEYENWYRAEFGQGRFTYGDDWGGFNIPSNIIHEAVVGATDLNEYDTVMQEIAVSIPDEKFYLVGTRASTTHKTTLNHELAHGLYHTDGVYRESMDEWVHELDERVFHRIRKTLLGYGYCPHVIIDEVQAYLSTGVGYALAFVDNKLCLPFEEVYNETVSRLTNKSDE